MLQDDLHVAQTEFFIQQNPVDIEVTRVARIKDGKGGWKDDSPRTLPLQTVRKVGASFVTGSTNVTLPDGRILIPTAVVIAMPDADLLVKDKFAIDDKKFEVVKVDRDPPWRTQAQVVEQV